MFIGSALYEIKYFFKKTINNERVRGHLALQLSVPVLWHCFPYSIETATGSVPACAQWVNRREHRLSTQAPHVSPLPFLANSL